MQSETVAVPGVGSKGTSDGISLSATAGATRQEEGGKREREKNGGNKRQEGERMRLGEWHW